MLQFCIQLKSYILTRVAHSVQSASPRDLSEVSTKQKKSSGKGKPDAPKAETSADLLVPSSDEFIPAPPKARGKKKPENSVPKPRYLLYTFIISWLLYFMYKVIIPWFIVNYFSFVFSLLTFGNSHIPLCELLGLFFTGNQFL